MALITGSFTTSSRGGGHDNFAFYGDAVKLISGVTKPHQQLAVRIRNVHLSYGSHRVLNGVNMNVPVKQIYGLLGPSGCGKTSLLRCVAGLRRPNSGSISVYGRAPGDPASGIPGPGIGYTPQEVALFPDFTIGETFEYFGRLFHLSVERIRRRTEELVRLLDLPDSGTSVNSLSGGQKRRVSLAVALIHSPPLLILDEPTVGVDPVLRQNIWDHLHRLTAQQLDLTIVVTTQYIEEARAADLVSFMRHGRLLAERNPTELLEQMNMPTLEAVFLHLCRMESSSITSDGGNNPKLLAVVGSGDRNECAADAAHMSISSGFRQPPLAFAARIRALNWKNLTAIRRNLSMLIIQFLMPSFQCVLNFACLGPDPYDIPVAVYNPDQPSVMSGLFTENLNNVTFRLLPHQTFESALEDVRQGLAWALISFPGNFTRLWQRYADEEAGPAAAIPQIGLYLDTTNYVITNVIQKELWQTFNRTVTLATELFGLTYDNETATGRATLQRNPFRTELVYGVTAPTMSEFMAPGLISMAIFFAAMALTAITLVLERKSGVFERTLVAGVRTVEFVVSQISTQFLVLAVQVLLSIITMFYIIDVENRGSISLIYLITLMQGMCGMALGLLVSAFSQNESQALALAMASFLPVSIISGIFWPVEAMPAVMKPVSYLGPQTYALEAMRSVMSRGWNLTHPLVIYGMVTPTAWFVALITLSSIGFHVISFG